MLAERLAERPGESFPNRADAPFHLARMQLLQDGAEVAHATADFVPAGANANELGLVTADKSGSGVVSIPLASVKRTSPLELRIAEPGEHKAFSVTGIHFE